MYNVKKLDYSEAKIHSGRIVNIFIGNIRNTCIAVHIYTFVIYFGCPPNNPNT